MTLLYSSTVVNEDTVAVQYLLVIKLETAVTNRRLVGRPAMSQRSQLIGESFTSEAWYILVSKSYLTWSTFDDLIVGHSGDKNHPNSTKLTELKMFNFQQAVEFDFVASVYRRATKSK